MAKLPKFEVGNILCDGRGWRRMIREVKENYLGVAGRYGYSYYNEEIDEHYKTTGAFDRFSLGLCSEAHMLQWMKKI